jgi:hypothetical protein
MGSVAILFHPERWLMAWAAVGGFVTTGEGPFGPDGQRTVGLLELGPTFPLAESWDSPRRREVERLKRQVVRPEARAAVVDYLLRRNATLGSCGAGPTLPAA